MPDFTQGAEGNYEIYYQGFLCNSVTLRRSRGIFPDSSLIQVFIPDFDSLEFSEGRSSNQKAVGEFSQPTTLYESGDLEISLTVNNDVHRVTAKYMYVSDVSKSDAYNKTGIVNITLLDERHLWNRGYMPRWRFNTFVLEERASLLDIAEIAISRLPGAAVLSRWPAGWEDVFPKYAFDEMGRPRQVLQRILDDYNAFLSLDFDGRIGIWLEGESEFDQFPPVSEIEHNAGQGAVIGNKFIYREPRVLVVGGDRIATVRVGNWEPVLMIDGVPIGLSEGLLDLSGAGVQGLEALRGVPIENDTVQDILDEAERLRRDALIALRLGNTEEYQELMSGVNDLVRQAQAARGGERNESLPTDPVEILLARIRNFLVRPDAWKTLNGFSTEGIEIIRRDAYRLFRLPGADTYNKELLPILKRAERDTDGKRQAPIVRRYGWEKVPHSAIGRQSDAVLRADRVKAILNRIRRILFGEEDADRTFLENAAELVFGREGGLQPVDPENINAAPDGLLAIYFQYLLGRDSNLNVDDVELSSKRKFAQQAASLLTKDDQSNVFLGNFQSAEVVIALEASGQSDFVPVWNEFVKEYHSAMQAAYPEYTGGLENELALTFYEAGKQIEKSGLITQAAGELSDLGANLEANPLLEVVAIYKPRVDELVDEIRRRKRFQDEDGTGDINFGKPAETYFFSNFDSPGVDSEARVEDAELGLIRTSGVACKLAEDRLQANSLPGVAELAPGPGPDQSWPVSVDFGVRVVPRFRESGVATQREPVKGDIIPPQIQEAIQSGKPRLGNFHAVFSESGGFVFDVDLGDLDPDLVSVSRPELVELITLSGLSNRSELLKEARVIAASRLQAATFQLSSRILYLYPRDIPTDGVTNGVEIRSRNNGLGLSTLVVRGRSDAPFDFANKTVTSGDLDKMRASRPLPGSIDFYD